ncbi:MAG: hypothetical protein ABL958_20890 [Bdellovibrionia bacterium]
MKSLLLLLVIMTYGLWVHAEPAAAKGAAPAVKAAKPAGPKVITRVKYKKTQELSFDSENVDGVARNPYGAYLTQKRGIEFTPLYKVRERFDENIKDSVHYMKVAK